MLTIRVKTLQEKGDELFLFLKNTFHAFGDNILQAIFFNKREIPILTN